MSIISHRQRVRLPRPELGFGGARVYDVAVESTDIRAVSGVSPTSPLLLLLAIGCRA